MGTVHVAGGGGGDMLGQACVDSFQTAAEAVQALAAQGPGSAGYTQLDVDFMTCSPMQSTQDLSILLSDLMGNVQVRIGGGAVEECVVHICRIRDILGD